VLGAQVQEERGQAEGGAEYHAGGHVAPAAALDADHLHERGRAHAERQVAPELVKADQEGPGTSGGGDVGQGMAGERLPARHGEHADDGGRHGDDGPDREGDVHRPAAEEAGLEDVPDQVTHDHLTTLTSSAAASAASTPSGAATTKTRPCTRITSTCWPYRRDRTPGWTTSSARPTATRPAAT